MKMNKQEGNVAVAEVNSPYSPPRLWAVLRKKDMSLVGVRNNRSRARALKKSLERGGASAVSKFTVKSYSVDL
jgi:hypothetical protein